ncbi:MAG: hypothetical protein AM326_01385 [Candidatus Thorarchaeota archaeon SMTZ-45]|nr:MAG: hypothetical protein AM326_01385 [Candidatus Thorarchaeota archaeon SMTZ-45]
MIELMIISTIIAAAVYLIHRHDQSPSEVQEARRARVKPWMITTVMLIIAFFGPISLNIYPGVGFMGGAVYIFSMTWQITDLATMTIVTFDISLVMVTGLLSFMRPVFVYQLARYYKGITTRVRAILAGIISELQLTAFTALAILYLLSNPIMSFVYIIAVPIPIPLLLGTVFIWLVPVPELAVPWKELDDTKDWWEEESEAHAEVIFEGN